MKRVTKKGYRYLKVQPHPKKSSCTKKRLATICKPPRKSGQEIQDQDMWEEHPKPAPAAR